jgi:hypothetical protein
LGNEPYFTKCKQVLNSVQFHSWSKVALSETLDFIANDYFFEKGCTSGTILGPVLFSVMANGILKTCQFI